MTPAIELNFNNEENFDQCMAELIVASKISFAYTKQTVDPRKALTVPEYLNVKCSAVLTFDNVDDARKFHNDKNCYEIFQKYAGDKS